MKKSKYNRLLLVYPPAGERSVVHNNGWLMEPLALEYIGAAVRSAEVRIIDMRLGDSLKDEAASFQPDLVGFTGYSVHVNSILRLAKAIKSMRPASDIVVGGHHATVRPDDFDRPAVDYIVVGEGCRPVDLLTRSANDAPVIPGLAYLKNGVRVYNPPKTLTDLDELPFPRRDLVSRHRSDYLYDYRECATIRTSVGCPYKCEFCSLWSIYGGKYLVRSPRKVIEELKQIVSPNIFLADDESMLNTERMWELAEMIEKHGISKNYQAYARADTIVRNVDLLARWSEIGLKRVSIGLETWSDERMNDLGKKSRIDVQSKAVEILHRLGITIDAQFIISPDYTPRDFRGMRDYVRKHSLWTSNFSILTPLPGSALWGRFKGKINDPNWDLWDTAHAVYGTRLPEKEFYARYYLLVLTFIPWWVRLRLISRYRLRDIVRRVFNGLHAVVQGLMGSLIRQQEQKA